jgi:protein O-mannosyl-transferase
MNIQDKYRSLFGHQGITIIFFFLLVLLVYFPTLFNGFIWDDDAIYDNQIIKSSDGLVQIWFNPKANTRELHYWPVVYTTFWIEHHFWVDNPVGYHLINILFHSLNVVLLWRLLLKIKIPGAVFCAALFAVHPVHVESVAWAIERKDVLSAFFYLATFLIYLQYQDKHTWIKYGLSLVLFLCALLSKSITVSFPVAFLLYLWWKNGTITKSALISLLPFFALAIAIAYFDVHLVNHRSILTPFGLTFLQRIYIAGRSLWFYLGKLIYPYSLITVYPRWNLTVNLFTQLFYPITFLTFMGIFYWGKKYFGSGIVAVFVLFTITVSPTLGLIDFSFMYHTFVADRFQYLASIGPIILLGAMGYIFYNPAPPRWKPGLRIIGISLITVLSFLTWKQADRYENDETLFRYTIAKNPNAWLAYNNLGYMLSANQKYEEAYQCFQKAIALKPDFVYVYDNLGLLLLKQNRTDEAIKYFQFAIQISPAFTEAYDNLGVALALQGKMNEAILYFKKALQLNPYNTQAKYNLEKAYRELNSSHR